MKKSLLALFVLSSSLATTANALSLKQDIRRFMIQKRVYSYRDARTLMFTKILNFSGEVCGVYSQKCIKTNKIPSATIMNTEHTWPQSKGAKRPPARSDLFHLYPTLSDINSARGSFPFCNVKNVKKEFFGISALGVSQDGTVCFEPPAEHKGNIARAMFYFSIRYDYPINATEEKIYRAWHEEDPVDENELAWHHNIKEYQGNENPFILSPELVAQIKDF